MCLNKRKNTGAMSDIITVSGESGVGKSTFSRQIAGALGYYHIEVDKLISKIYQNKAFCKKIINAFGVSVLKGVEVDRKKVGQIVFASQSKQSVLTKISTPYIEKEIKSLKKQHGKVIIDYKFAPLLKEFENSFKVLLTTSCTEKRLSYVASRDKLPDAYISKRDKNGLCYENYHFDAIIDHDYDNLSAQTAKFIASMETGR